VLIVLVVLLPLLDHAPDKQSLNATGFGNESEMACMSDCAFSLVESIPVQLAYPNGSVVHRSTYTTWLDLIGAARNTIEIASLYWTMNREDVYPDDSAKEGEDVFQALVYAGRDRRVTLRIAQNAPSHISPNIDTEHLAKKANAQVSANESCELSVSDDYRQGYAVWSTSSHCCAIFARIIQPEIRLMDKPLRMNGLIRYFSLV
jgi:phospholipase D3/4